MNDVAIEVDGLRKRFGPRVALDGMTFTVAPGQVTGFIGPNGAGKSTTMRVILAWTHPIRAVRWSAGGLMRACGIR
jgi:ABC-2 type transport system ATP-binding protein